MTLAEHLSSLHVDDAETINLLVAQGDTTPQQNTYIRNGYGRRPYVVWEILIGGAVATLDNRISIMTTLMDISVLQVDGPNGPPDLTGDIFTVWHHARAAHWYVDELMPGVSKRGLPIKEAETPPAFVSLEHFSGAIATVRLRFGYA